MISRYFFYINHRFFAILNLKIAKFNSTVPWGNGYVEIKISIHRVTKDTKKSIPSNTNAINTYHSTFFLALGIIGRIKTQKLLLLSFPLLEPLTYILSPLSYVQAQSNFLNMHADSNIPIIFLKKKR